MRTCPNWHLIISFRLSYFLSSFIHEKDGFLFILPCNKLKKTCSIMITLSIRQLTVKCYTWWYWWWPWFNKKYAVFHFSRYQVFLFWYRLSLKIIKNLLSSVRATLSVLPHSNANNIVALFDINQINNFFIKNTCTFLPALR